MNVTAAFGGVGLFTAREPAQTVSWWLGVGQENWTARCWKEYETRLRGSLWERMVGFVQADATIRFADRASKAGGKWGTSHAA